VSLVSPVHFRSPRLDALFLTFTFPDASNPSIGESGSPLLVVPREDSGPAGDIGLTFDSKGSFESVYLLCSAYTFNLKYVATEACPEEVRAMELNAWTLQQKVEV